MAGFNNYYNNGYAYPGYVPPVNNWGNTVTQAPVQQTNPNQQIFVHGRAGADAFQMPAGVNMVTLWDDEVDRFYIKGYDNTGRPRVLADNDFQPHIEPEVQPQQTPIDPNALQKMINDAVASIHIPQPNLEGYVTQAQFNQALSELSVGNGGRIVRSNEHDA